MLTDSQRRALVAKLAELAPLSQSAEMSGPLIFIGHHNNAPDGLKFATELADVFRYDGKALFGPLTGQPVDLMGVSQFLVQDGRIVREKRVYDDLALRAQINSTRGDSAVANTNIY